MFTPPMNWFKVRVEFGGFPATHTTFYRRYGWEVWVSNVIKDLMREFPGAVAVHIREGGIE